ncbi:MAG: DUF4362 domain-containing protein [Peptococcaceae bacterium]|jgi:hypothetical protein|nr:DUF4362 domain-containing protein [Peptococcaceae bacterium]
MENKIKRLGADNTGAGSVTRMSSLATLLAAILCVGILGGLVACSAATTGYDPLPTPTGDLAIQDLPANYSQEQAIADGVYVNIFNAERYNQSVVDEFYNNALAGQAAFMRSMIDTVEGDPVITDYQFDGAVFTVTTDTRRDTFGASEIAVTTYKYLMPQADVTPENSALIYYLSNERDQDIDTTTPDGWATIPSPSYGYTPDQSADAVSIEKTAIVTRETVLYEDAEFKTKTVDVHKNDLVYVIAKEAQGYYVQLPVVQIPPTEGYVSLDVLSFDEDRFASLANYGSLTDAILLNTPDAEDIYRNPYDGTASLYNGLVRIKERLNGEFVLCGLLGGAEDKWVVSRDIGYQLKRVIYHQ